MKQLDPDAIAASLSAEEQADLLSGVGLWRTGAVPRLGIPSLLMTDGTYGVRYSIDQIDRSADRNIDLDAFLDTVNRKADAMGGAFGLTRPATCFPNGSSAGCSWDAGLIYRMGAALAEECRAFGVDLLLGPGINLRRTPFAGRGYEYYSEDPVVSGDLAAGLINGLQDNGVGASLKHFACNNSEIERTTMDSVVDERALRELYLRGFQRTIEKSAPWTVMSSYNVLNGVQASQHRWLLTTVLRKEWGYQGLVMSDWHGIKDRVAALNAGNDLDMPESSTRRRKLLSGLRDGSVDLDNAREASRRMVELVNRAVAGRREPHEFDAGAHHRLAQQVAAESLVLLKNDGGLLPLSSNRVRRIAVVGEGAVKPVIQGSGSATTQPTQVDIPLEEIRRVAGAAVSVDYYSGYRDDGDATGNAVLAECALAGARGADAVIVFAHCSVGVDGEGADRQSLNLLHAHERLIETLAAQELPMVVILCVQDAVLLPWAQDVAAIVAPFFAGQGMGRAVADMLFGKLNPSGKLTVTFPRKAQDVPGYLTYPGESGKHRYAEGIFVGYRYYDALDIEPRFPFGFGLSFTTFLLANLKVDRGRFRRGETVTVTFDVTNTGAMAGSEVCQLYIGHPGAVIRRAVRELKAFSKVYVEPDETRQVTMELDARDIEYFDTASGSWRAANGEFVVSIGTSSRDICLSTTLLFEGEAVYYPELTLDSQPKRVLENPVATRMFAEFLSTRLSIDAESAARLLVHIRGSFFGLFTSMSLMLNKSISEDEIANLLVRVNQATAAARTESPVILFSED